MAGTNKAVADYFKNFENLTFGQRITYAIETKGVSKAWVAERLGISKQALNYLLRHSIKAKFVDELAELLKLDPIWIEKGIGTPFTMQKEIKAPANKTLPIVNKAILLGQESQNQQESIDFSNSHIESFIAYRLQDDSNFPPFIEGSILIFNKEKQPNNEDYVLFAMEGDIFVRQCLIDGAHICLKASNNRHRTFINPNVIILGVLVEVRYKLS